MAGIDAPKHSLPPFSSSEPITIPSQREKSYYLIQSRMRWLQTVYDADGNAYQIQPLVAVKTNFEGWRAAPIVHERLKAVYTITGDITYGRQFGTANVGGEVELFTMPDGKEAVGLRQEMERAGLAVRSWEPTSSNTRSPSCGLTFRPEQTFREKCHHVFQKRVDEWEDESAERVRYALVADSGGRGLTKHLLVVIVEENDFDALAKAAVAGEHTTITTGDYVYDIVGFYGDRRFSFVGGDNELKAFFGKSGSQVAVAWFNLKKDRENAAVEQYKRQKKAAKKQRRQQPASGPAAGCGNTEDKNGDGAAAETEEAWKQKVKVKVKAKKKAYGARHKFDRQEQDSNGAGHVATFLVGPAGLPVAVNTGDNKKIVISWLDAAHRDRRVFNSISSFGQTPDDDDGLGSRHLTEMTCLNGKYVRNPESVEDEEGADGLGITMASTGGRGGDSSRSSRRDDKNSRRGR